MPASMNYLSRLRLACIVGLLGTIGCAPANDPAPPNTKTEQADVPAASSPAADSPDAAGGSAVDEKPAARTNTPPTAGDVPWPKESDASPAATSAAPPAPAPDPMPPKQLLAEVEGLKRLTPDFDVWLDPEKKRVVMLGRVVRQEGQLEMFACLKNTKEHESIVAVNSKAFIINAALIALGANPGTPVQFRPEFQPAKGPVVDVSVVWTDEKGKRQRTRAQEWIRNIKTGKPLDQPWVFGGSGFWVDEATGEKHFMAEDGDFICISNFNSAMLDLPVESSQASAQLQFEAFTERIPPVGTHVILVLAPKIEKSGDAEKKAEEATSEE